ncbi:hypothetical protein [Sporofaciens musculi]|uniref:hypothetical protein n=1 Tax=Sporofaciens musculi TaxID=2681861 RepID=UPI00256FAD14|nr:hypothetical protein [Sporofaciens musculi]
MSEEFEKRLDFDSDTFDQMKKDMNFVLQRLIGNMQEKGTNEGSMTLKIDVTMVKEFIPNYDPDVEGETREISKPQFKHKVTSAVKINDEKSGAFNNEMELVMDEDTGVFKLVPIANTSQRSIFDSDFQQHGDEQEGEGEKTADSNAIDGKNVPMLPGPDTEAEVIDGEFREADATEDRSGEKTAEEPGEELEDITDELLGPEDPDDGYGYEEPED